MRFLDLGHGFIRELHFDSGGHNLLVVWGDDLHKLGLKVVDLISTSIVREESVKYGELALTLDLTTMVRVNMDLEQFPPLAFLEVHELGKKRLLQRLPMRIQHTCLAFSPDSQLLLVAGANYSAEEPTYEVDRWLWHTVNDLPPLTVPGQVVSMTMTRDRRLLVTGGNDNAVRFWRNDSGILFDEWKHKATVRRLLFSEDDRTLIAAAGCSVALWNVAQRRQRARLRPHRKQVNDIALSSDGRLLATASNDGTVRLWDAANASELRTFNWNIGKVGAVAFSPDGLTMVAGGEFGQIVFWDVDS